MANEEKRLQYKVKPGFTHGVGKKYKAGDVVELTAQEAAGFLDKLELATGKQAKATPAGEPTDLRAAIAEASDADLAAALGVDAATLAALRQGKGATKPGGLIVNPVDGVAAVEKQLEAETGHDVVQTGVEPPTLVETDQPVDNPPAAAFDVAGSTVEAVLAAVKEGKITANDALIAEQQGTAKRRTLLAELGKLVEAESKPQE